MQSLVVLILFFLILPTHLWAVCGTACTRSVTTWTCTDVSYDCVNAIMTHESFAEGDTIHLNAGTATWGSTLSVTKGCTIEGAGVDSTVISYDTASDETNIINFTPSHDSAAANSAFEIKNIAFTSLVDMTALAVHAIRLTNSYFEHPVSKIKIHDNKFTNMKFVIDVTGATWGVAYNNDMVNSRTPCRGYGLDELNWNAFTKITWLDDSAKWFYCEDNVSRWTGTQPSANAGWTATGQGGRIAVRYHTYDYTNIDKCERIIDESCYGNMIQVWENHDSWTDSRYAPMGGMYYGNLVEHDMGDNGRNWGGVFLSRGGKALWFYNNMVDLNVAAVTAGIWNEYINKTVDSPESIQHPNDSYFWNNRKPNGDLILTGASASPEACLGTAWQSFSGACYNTTPPITPVVSGTATGGSNKTVIDTTKNFVTSGVTTGMYVMNSSSTAYGVTSGCAITSITTTTNTNDTLNCTDTLTDTWDNGDLYYVSPATGGLAENTDWWQQKSGTFDGTGITGGGVGCGTTKPETCTAGVAFWQTTQGNCTDPTGWVGRSNDRTSGTATKIEGTLYKCTATNTWTSYFIPYTYPHPLRGESNVNSVTSMGTGATVKNLGTGWIISDVR